MYNKIGKTKAAMRIRFYMVFKEKALLENNFDKADDAVKNKNERKD